MKAPSAKLSSVVAVTVSCLLVVGVVGTAASQTWTPLTNQAPVSMGAMLLLTDGRVLVHEEPNCNPGTGCVGSDYTAWYTLTPDSTGSYINGTWTKVASLPTGYSPLFFSSAVLPDGKVGIQGGEYNCPTTGCADAWQSLGALYDPVADTWTSISPEVTNSWQVDGDAQSIVLPNGTWMTAACCAKVQSKSTFPLYFYFNESALSFTSEASSSDGKADEFDEEGWTLLPNGKVLTVDAYVGSYNSAGKNSELYNPSTNTWSTAGSTGAQLWDDACGNSSKASYEVGPAVLLPNGTVFYTGASECNAGNIATYNWSTGTWTAQSAFPNKDAANDAPAAVETNGNAIVMTSPYSGTFSTPSTFYEWNGTTLSTFPNPANAANDASYVGHLLVLPTGQIMFTDFTTGVAILTTAGTYQSAWQPTITTAPFTLTPGTTYSISGTQFNGLTAGSAYGDDFQDATNYPLVRIVNNATGHVYYARTHGHSTMGVATGSTAVSTNFDVPSSMPTGPCELYVVANGIPSAASACNVGASTPSTTTVSSSANPATYGQSVTFTATVTGSGGTPTGTVTFTANSSTIAGCSAVALSSGTAHCTTSLLFVGSETIGASYSGDSNFTTSSGTLTQTVNQASVSVSVSANLNPSTYGQSVTFTATISGANGQVKGRKSGKNGTNPMTPTGTVTWSANTGCTPSTLSGSPGIATCSTTSLPAGTDTITATYSGDGNHSGGSGTLSGGQVVSQVSSSTSVSSTLNPSSYGQAVSFTATVTGSSPTGTVQFNVDGSAFGSQVTVASGSASSGSISTLTAGTHTVTAVYSGDANNAGSTGTLSGGQVVNAAGAGSITVGSSLNPSTYGQSVTFTASIPGQYGLVKGRKNGARPMNVTGTVTWSSNTGCGTTTVASGNPGTATCTTSSLPVGSDTVTANYSGDSNHNAGSGSMSQTVSQASSSTSVSSSLNPSSYGQAVSFTASVTGSSPTGTVQFSVDGSAFGSPVTLNSGSANSGSTSTLAAGAHTVTAAYSGDTNNAGSMGTLSGGQLVNQASQTITFTKNAPGSAAYNSQFMVAATASSGLTVAFTSNGACTNSGATYTMTSGTGACSVIANQTGNASYSTAPTVTQTVNAAAASQTVSFTIAPPSSAVYGSNFTIAATASSGLTVTYTSAGGCTNSGATYSMTSGTTACSVTASQAGNTNYTAASSSQSVTATKATNTVTFTTAAPRSAEYGSTFAVAASGLGTGAITYSSGGACSNSGATYTMTSGTGTCTETATQAADSNYASANAFESTTATPANSSVSVASGQNPSAYGQSVTFTATIGSDTGQVKGRKGAAGQKPTTVTGSVTWSANTGCGTTAVTSSGYPATATCTTTSLPVGTDAITTTYSGDSNHNAGSGSVDQTVNQVSSSTTVSSSLNPSSYGQAVIFTASVTGSSPTGTVTFYVDGNQFDTETLISGSAYSIGTSALAAGMHTVTATFSGDTNNAGSTGTLSGGQAVSAAGASVSVASSLNPSTYGQSVTFTATISGVNGLFKGRNGRKPLDVTGTVAWSANTGCGTTAVASGNPGTATCSTSNLQSGNNTITATYSGDGNHSGGSGLVSQQVNPASQTITCNAPPTAAPYNSTFTVSCTVTSGLPVSYSSSGSCSNSGATYTITSGLGTCSVIANQSGNNDWLPAPPVTIPVTATRASQTITCSVGAPPTATYKSSFTLVCSAPGSAVLAYASTGVCTNSGSTFTVAKPSGICTEMVSAPGNSDYAAATLTASTMVVAAVAPTVSLTGEPVTATVGTTFTVTASSNETGAVSIPVISTTTPTICSVGAGTNSGSGVSATVTMLIGTGSCQLKAAWVANYVYKAATASAHTAGAKIVPAVIFTGAPATAANGSTFTVTATSNENESVVSVPTIAATPATVCTVGAVTSNASGEYQATVTMIKATGTCTTKATWALNSDYAAASVMQHTTATAH